MSNKKLIKVMDELDMDYALQRTVHPCNPSWTKSIPVKDPFWVCGIPFAWDKSELNDIDLRMSAYGKTPLQAARNALKLKKENQNGLQKNVGRFGKTGIF